MITADEFKKLQMAQLEIMDEIHSLCAQNNVCYYIIGGTALGAVRHKGFIPWDLDIDIAMPRSSYDRFKKICNAELNGRYVYHDFQNTKDYNHPHALVCIKNSVLKHKFCKYNPSEENLGIYVDIFPLDNAPNKKEDQKKQAKLLKRIKKQKKYKVGYLYDNSKYKRIVKGAIKKLLFWENIDGLNYKFDKVSRRYNSTDTNYLCSMASHFSYEKQCMPKEIYGEPQLVDFENRKFYAPQKIKEYLEIIYGDYMKLPPISERNANMNALESVVFP